MKTMLLGFAVLATAAASNGCNPEVASKSAAGVSQQVATVPLGSDGLTTEQRNIRNRLEIDNKPGSI